MSGSLTRQSVLVAGFCLLADTLTFYYAGVHVNPALPFWCLLAGVVLVDAALASSARLSGVVAFAHAALAVAGALLLSGGTPGRDLNDAGMLIAAYRAGAWLNGRPAVLALLFLVAGSIGARTLGGSTDITDWRTVLLGTVKEALLAWLVGRYTTARGAHIAELEQRASRERESARQELADAIADDRSAIARDLHDVIAHHVSAIGVHAGAARLGLSGQKASPVSTALAAVETSSRAALLDLRRLLDFLHDSPVEGARQPGLGNLDELIHVVSAAGLEANISVQGARLELEGSLDIAVYRVVQEMLTNALRHGNGRVDITICYETPCVSVIAINPIAASKRLVEDSPRRGLEGISSRASMFSGFASYGPVNGGADWKTSVTFSMDGT
ncbi:sensor histidine kinase [Streptomyces adelaidensis]|uniref:sensor histidine kinase n=1 Tax=Streptomyces adelaidensis TaxID=2796465 RepID=UPI001907B075|nr:histidine kinase [Streptomyces adelaidensis]